MTAVLASSLGRTVGRVLADLDRGDAAAALVRVRLDGFETVPEFISSVEERSTAKWVWASGLGALASAVETCEEHGEQLVRDSGPTPGPDPWTWCRLACGCTVVPM